MQFKYPELLWGLLLLLIPILVHLFQLRKFKKTPFTNVKLLQKVVAESRRSNTLKKWLLLLTRLGLLAALVLAFAQPFFAEKSALVKKETVVYLDDSFSMQAQTDQGSFLALAIQELIKAVPAEETITLFTNEKVFKNVAIKNIQNELLGLEHSIKQLTLNELQLKANTLFNEAQDETQKQLIVLSDFQERMNSILPTEERELRLHLVDLRQAGIPENISIDSAYISTNSPAKLELTALFSANYKTQDVAVSLFNGERLMAKTSVNLDNDGVGSLVFSLPREEAIQGKIQIQDNELSYDNQLYFNIGEKEIIKVLSVYAKETDFLQRIFTEDEFEFRELPLSGLDYSILESRNLIILNQLPSIPSSLQNSLRSFYENGGALCIIPSAGASLDSYNGLLGSFGGIRVQEYTKAEKSITNIGFSHPLYQNVFEKQITNFQYPKVSGSFALNSGVGKALSFQDNSPFLVGRNNFYLFTAPLDQATTNFTSSPLVVPTFYAMATNSLQLPALYHSIGLNTQVDIPISLAKDRILKITKEDYTFIPEQRAFANKVSLRFSSNPIYDGSYQIMNEDQGIEHISFNYPRTESRLTYLDLSNINASSKSTSIGELFNLLQKENALTTLWKWFVILALLFVIAELLIQKFFK